MTLKHAEYLRIVMPSTLRESAEDILLLENGLCVQEDLADRVQRHLEDKTSELELGVKSTLKQICDDDFWRQLSRFERIAAGKYVAYLVARKQLPLSFSGKTSSNWQLYIRN